ncbi:hypothetical protein XENOCAPTIV_005371 [Xenoophorus captivus]|uniref:Uncharacterized protein n=1 Tax=Xenoophorus captivus TaxID=1517983 RepID=A0ABV0S5B2_9TELE
MIYREVQFRRSRLVIDGCNLNYLLYFKSGLDENHGGEYAAYRNLIENFITALRTCEITPYVVLDGGSDVTVKRWKQSQRGLKIGSREHIKQQSEENT